MLLCSNQTLVGSCFVSAPKHNVLGVDAPFFQPWLFENQSFSHIFPGFPAISFLLYPHNVHFVGVQR